MTATKPGNSQFKHNPDPFLTILSFWSWLRLPFWKLPANVDSGVKVERELRTFSNRLKRHHLGEGVISLDEHSTSLLSNMVSSLSAF